MLQSINRKELAMGLLSLSRKCGESIMIDDDVEVIVTRIQGNRVRLGVIAARDIRIKRKELPDQDEKKSA
jgi:carbon storage regulator